MNRTFSLLNLPVISTLPSTQVQPARPAPSNSQPLPNDRLHSPVHSYSNTPPSQNYQPVTPPMVVNPFSASTPNHGLSSSSGSPEVGAAPPHPASGSSSSSSSSSSGNLSGHLPGPSPDKPGSAAVPPETTPAYPPPFPASSSLTSSRHPHPSSWPPHEAFLHHTPYPTHSAASSRYPFQQK